MMISSQNPNLIIKKLGEYGQLNLKLAERSKAQIKDELNKK